MKANERRKAIISHLNSERRPISGAELSSILGVSRQIIVQDIAMLRREGYDIIPTHSGYYFPDSPLKARDFKLKHTTEQTEDELNIIVENGGTVENVYVWHKVYGKIEAQLNIFSKAQVKQFMEGVRTGKSVELMNITGGYHYHTVRADTEEALDKIEVALKTKGYVVPEEEQL